MLTNALTFAASLVTAEVMLSALLRRTLTSYLVLVAILTVLIIDQILFKTRDEQTIPIAQLLQPPVILAHGSLRILSYSFNLKMVSHR